jgi:hypothetical protein
MKRARIVQELSSVGKTLPPQEGFKLPLSSFLAGGGSIYLLSNTSGRS